MHSLAANYLKSITLSTKHASSIQKIGEYKGKQQLFTTQTPEILESLKQVAMVESTESSNRLEGITAPASRIKDLVAQKAKPTNRSEQEISGYRDSLNLIHEKARILPFSVKTILTLHEMIYRYLPETGGRWKEKDNQIIDRYPDGSTRVRFNPVSAARTPESMELLVNRYQDALRDGQEPLILIPLTILDFLCIHPFTDGNGRVARLLTLMLLYDFGYEVGRYISLERIFEQTEQGYYDTLEKCSWAWHDGNHTAKPWMEYFWGILLRAYKEFESRVGAIRSGKGAKTAMVKDAVARRLAPFSLSDLKADCPRVSADMIRNVLRELRDQGKIQLTGTGRGSKWVPKGK